MKLTNPYKHDFINLFNAIAPDKRRHTVFQDFVEMASYSLHNALIWSNEFEGSYLSIAQRYKAEDLISMSKLLALTIVGLEHSPGDFLGDVYMALKLGDSQRGHFFTPFTVASMMAKMTLHDIEALVKKMDFLPLANQHVVQVVWP